MRSALWPDADAVELDAEAHAMLEGDGDAAAFVAEAGGGVVGMAEASLRREYVNGTGSSPVGFLEGWYVVPAWRGRGVGRALVAAVEEWTRAQGCGELASDALADNRASLAAHAACGFEQTERVVYFRKPVR
ncbi:aminoglycoside 6'-N-acetyltransferase [Pseudoxanthomonas suwonensis]|uniref:Aminoglycoside N(6')-acetyltransferase type 1 n=1 Tax=Pseudoxanthomonas suwonensis TaxID=314722 RepID=A0A0E3UQ39_9GAMM|nr:aminoglycoside 6'-N-acetyltransferase [Pseudoxanthomonas suwonensis]AKC88380.1 aminoglycoside 6'-acetyltransferase [Pseudoxanthomonas suwonensis]